MENLARRLEQCLTTWEDLCFFLKLLGMMDVAQRRPPRFPARGPILHAPEFRSFLLARNDTFDDARFGFDLAMLQSHARDLARTIMAQAFTLYTWCTQSRRVIALDASMQLLLAHTRLGAFTWQDIPRPLPSILIALPIPLQDADGCAYDALAVTSVAEGGRALTKIELFPTSLEEYRSPSEQRRAHMLRLAKKGQWDALEHELDARTRMYAQRAGIVAFSFDDSVLIERTFAAYAEDIPQLFGDTNAGAGSDRYRGSASLFPVASRIAAGALLSMTVESRGLERAPILARPRATSTPPPVGRIDAGVVVCPLASPQQLTACEQDAATRALAHAIHPDRCAPCPHFRIGHWRRPPGSAIDASKTIWVRPALIGAEHLPPGALPAGHVSTLS